MLPSSAWLRIRLQTSLALPLITAAMLIASCFFAWLAVDAMPPARFLPLLAIAALLALSAVGIVVYALRKQPDLLRSDRAWVVEQTIKFYGSDEQTEVEKDRLERSLPALLSQSPSNVLLGPPGKDSGPDTASGEDEDA